MYPQQFFLLAAVEAVRDDDQASVRSVEGVHALRQLRHDVNFLLQPLHETLQLEPLHPDVNKKYENTNCIST